jgi:electron transfer flavoprotein beta subunit
LVGKNITQQFIFCNAASGKSSRRSKQKLKIAVCLKQILDPDIPAREFQIDENSMQAQRDAANLVTNIFCENALETALQFREKSGGGEITAVSFGAETAEDSLRKALAMTADAACLIANETFAHPDAFAVARVLAAGLKKLGAFDLILVGRESGDWGAGQVGGLLAEELNLPFVAFVDSIEKTAGGVKLKRQTGSGYEIIEAGRQSSRLSPTTIKTCRASLKRAI